MNDPTDEEEQAPRAVEAETGILGLPTKEPEPLAPGAIVPLALAPLGFELTPEAVREQIAVRDRALQETNERYLGAVRALQAVHHTLGDYDLLKVEVEDLRRSNRQLEARNVGLSDRVEELMGVRRDENGEVISGFAKTVVVDELGLLGPVTKMSDINDEKRWDPNPLQQLERDEMRRALGGEPVDPSAPRTVKCVRCHWTGVPLVTIAGQAVKTCPRCGAELPPFT